ncbi:MAG TPA: AlpA family phage regulatory protein [Macromonas sp.]|nr:AlpA family phage regulatory protein [Macromonas sp.]
MQASPSNAAQVERLLKLPEVEARVGLKKSSIYSGVAAGTFPAPVRLSRRCVCWPSSRIDAWIAARIQAGGV